MIGNKAKRKKAQAAARRVIKLVREGATDAQNALARVKKARGVIEIITEGYGAIQYLVRYVQDHSGDVREVMSGAEKQAVAVEVVMILLPKRSWYVPDWFLRKVLARLVDLAVKEVKKRLGQQKPGRKSPSRDCHS